VILEEESKEINNQEFNSPLENNLDTSDLIDKVHADILDICADIEYNNNIINNQSDFDRLLDVLNNGHFNGIDVNVIEIINNILNTGSVEDITMSFILLFTSNRINFIKKYLIPIIKLLFNIYLAKNLIFPPILDLPILPN
jgi:hypothetical protein